MNAIRVLIADDHTILRAGIRSLLEGMADIEVVGEAADGLETLALVRIHRPDILLTDITMPGMNGLTLTGRLTEEYPRTKVVILTMHTDEEYVQRAVTLGAAGYLLKDSDTDELERALRAVARGGSYLSPNVSRHLIGPHRKTEDRNSAQAIHLTRRQLEVLRLIAEGKTSKAIARTLDISIKTVESHRTLLMERLGIFDIAGLVRYAIRVGLIAVEE